MSAQQIITENRKYTTATPVILGYSKFLFSLPKFTLLLTV